MKIPSARRLTIANLDFEPPLWLKNFSYNFPFCYLYVADSYRITGHLILLQSVIACLYLYIQALQGATAVL